MCFHTYVRMSQADPRARRAICACVSDKLRGMKAKLSSIATVNDQTERLLSFSDAVFAIAMTFLALDLGAIPLDVGDAGGPTTGDYIRENVTDYAVYFGTFLVVGFLWWRHHLMFRYIKRSTPLLIWINTFMLALVAALPYPASIVSEAPELGLAVLMLLFPLALIGVLMLLEWEVAVRQKLVIPGLPKRYASYIRAQLTASPIVLLLASALATLSWLKDSSIALQFAAGMWALLIVLPLVLRHFWPTPDRAYEVDIDTLSPQWQSLEETAAEETHRIRGLLARLRNGSDTDRLIVLTDGVVAIAVTILALQLRPPTPDETITNEVLLENLKDAPTWTYIVTFVLISLFWRGHVRIFSSLRGADPVVLWLNLLFLMFISFLPTTAALQARDESTTAVAFYLLMMFFTGAAMAVLGQYGLRAKNLTVTVGNAAERRLGLIRSVTAVTAFLIAFILVVAFNNPALSNVVWVIFIISGRYSAYALRKIKREELTESQHFAKT